MIFTPLILAGGSGTRLWPISRTSMPKQFSNFFGEYSLFQQTVLRVSNRKIFTKPIIICSNEHRFLALSQLQALKIKDFTIILEPVAKSTAPAIAIASNFITKNLDLYSPNMLILSSDHQISDIENFNKYVAYASDYVNDFFITFGIKPTHPNRDYGYIILGNQFKRNNHIFHSKKFIEKPELEIAKKLFKRKKVVWNSGIFCINCHNFLDKIQQINPLLQESSLQAINNAKIDYEFLLLDENHFSKSPNISIDYCLFENADNVAVIPMNIAWQDLGTWSNIYQNSNKDKNQNTIIGNVVINNTSSCYINSPKQLIATSDISNLIIVSTDDAILIADKNNLKNIRILHQKIAEMNPLFTKESLISFRPWGLFEILNSSVFYKVKRIVVNPHCSLSLQKHHHRSEHWVVISGTANIKIDETDIVLYPNQSTFIPRETKHQLSNNHDKILEIIEIQTGEYLEEDDIVRFNDLYGR